MDKDPERENLPPFANVGVDYYTAIKKLIQIHTSNVNLRFISCFPLFFINTSAVISIQIRIKKNKETYETLWMCFNVLEILLTISYK